MICYKTKYFKSEIYSHSTKLNILNLKYGPPKSGAIYCRVREYALREKVVKKKLAECYFRQEQVIHKLTQGLFAHLDAGALSQAQSDIVEFVRGRL